MESIYLGHPGIDRHHLIFISLYHTMKIHTVSFPTFGLTHSIQDFMEPHNSMNPHGREVSYLLTLFLSSLSPNSSVSQIPFGSRNRCGGWLIAGSLRSSSVISPQRLPSGAFLGSPNGHLEVLL